MANQSPNLQTIKNYLYIQGINQGSENNYYLYRAEGENSIDGFHQATIYIYSNPASNSQKAISFSDIQNKAISITQEITFGDKSRYSDTIIAGLPQSIEAFLIPPDLGLLGYKFIKYFYKIKLMTNYWRLTQDKNNRVYSSGQLTGGITVYDTLEKVFKDCYLSEQDYDMSKITGAAAKSVQHHCFVQYNEPTHDFIKRLMAIGNIFAYDGFKQQGENLLPCRFFVDSNQYQIYDKYKAEVFHQSQFSATWGDPLGQHKAGNLNQAIGSEFATVNTQGGLDWSYIRSFNQNLQAVPYYKKRKGFYMVGSREEVNISQVNWYQYDPDDFTQEIKGYTGSEGEGFAPQYYIYSQGTTSSDCSTQAKALLNRLKSNTFITMYSTLPVTRVGCLLETEKTTYKTEANVADNYVIYKSKYVFGFPENIHLLYASLRESHLNLSETAVDFYEYNFELTCLPKENYPPAMTDISESPAIGKFLDALVINGSDGKTEASSEYKVSVNEVGDVYVGLYLEYMAKNKGYSEFTPVRVKMNTTNGNTTPMVNTPCAIMIQEFGGMFVYCGQRHDQTNKPMYPPEINDYIQRHDINPPAMEQRLCICWDHTQDKNVLTSLSQYDIVETAQNDIKETAEKDITYSAKQNITQTSEQDTLHEAKGSYTNKAQGLILMETQSTYTAKSDAAMEFNSKASYNVEATALAGFKSGPEMSFQSEIIMATATAEMTLKATTSIMAQTLSFELMADAEVLFTAPSFTMTIEAVTLTGEIMVNETVTCHGIVVIPP